MTRELFISDNTLRQFTDINNNQAAAYMKPSIREAQDIEIQRMLGYHLYERLKRGVFMSDLTDTEKGLLSDFIVPALTYWAYYYTIENVFIQTRNGGVTNGGGTEGSSVVDVDLYDRKRNSIRQKAEYYSELLVNHLLANSSDYPEYSQGGELDKPAADTSNQRHASPFVNPSLTQGGMLANKMGWKTTNSAYPYLPPSKNNFYKY